MKNPYLSAYKRAVKKSQYWGRQKLVWKFSWAIPTKKAIVDIAAFGSHRIIEMGAGSGYWAWMLRQAGCHVLPYDNNYRKEYIGKRFVRVFRGEPSITSLHSDRALMLCWPEYNNPMAFDCLSHFSGSKLIYVGEGSDGCTGDEDFHKMLEEEWNRVKEIDIPQWGGLHDYVSLYERRTHGIL